MCNKPYTDEELRNIMFSDKDYPLVFPDNIGLGIRDELSHTELRIKHEDGTRHVTLVMKKFPNRYTRSIHIYGTLVVDGVIRVQDWWNIEVELASQMLYMQPISSPEYKFFLQRPLTEGDMDEKDEWGHLRWQGYKVGEYVMAFKTVEDLIQCVKKLFAQCFKGKWSLWLEDATGFGITRTLLIPYKNNTDYEKNT